MHRFFIVITGPTAVGKTAFVDELIAQLPFPTGIINGDMGQLYTPLTIGTAKPDYIGHEVPHYLFDRLDKPINYTADQYRSEVLAAMEQIWAQGSVPIIVGGSGFYIKSLFYAYQVSAQIGEVPCDLAELSTPELYDKLQSIDQERAAAINVNDRYRIMRALEIWYQTGKKPSECNPLYEPLAPGYLILLERETANLDSRIYQRTAQMIHTGGWLDEVEQLPKQWKEFVLQKKIIGYPEIIDYQQTKTITQEKLIQDIALKTRQYAKRQRTFFRALMSQVQREEMGRNQVKILTINLTLSSPALYLDTLKSIITDEKKDE